MSDVILDMVNLRLAECQAYILTPQTLTENSEVFLHGSSFSYDMILWLMWGVLFSAGEGVSIRWSWSINLHSSTR